MLIKLLAVLAVTLFTAVVFAPAAWVGDLVQARTPARLVHAQGTIWHGSALLAVSDGQQARLVPGRLSWQVAWDQLPAGRIGVSLQHPALQPGARIATDGRSLELGPGELRMPASVLAALGAPFNTMRPGGTLHAKWDALRLEQDAFAGLIQVDWEDAQSALSPVAPLGAYRLTALGRGAAAETKLTTLKGPLLVQGEGRLENGRARFRGTATAEPEMAASLRGLIGVLGQRVGDRAVLNWEL
jgi:general secretion pathway protein N